MLNNDLSIKIYQAIADANEDRVFKHWHASSIAECPRAQYFKRLGIPAIEKPTSAKILRWQGGHALEEAIREHIASVYGEVESNQRFTSKTYDLTGEYDNYEPTAKRLIEIKSISDYAFKEQDGVTALKEQVGVHPNGNRKWGLKQTPYLNHELQNHAYALLLDEIGIEVKYIDYVYISLHGRVVTYSTEVSNDLTNQVLKRLEALNEAWEEKVPPVCICQEGHPLYEPVMQWCNFREGDRCCSLDLIKGEKDEQ